LSGLDFLAFDSTNLSKEEWKEKKKKKKKEKKKKNLENRDRIYSLEVTVGIFLSFFFLFFLSTALHG